MDLILGSVMMLLVAASVIGYLILQPLLVFRCSGVWRIAALLPLVVVVAAIIHAGLAFSRGANLWPMAILVAMPYGFLYLLIVAGAWRWAHPPARPE